jgi:hypothetical protein
MKKKEDRGKKNMSWACNRGCAGEEEKKEKRKKTRKNRISKGHVARREGVGEISLFFKPPTIINYTRTPKSFNPII